MGKILILGNKDRDILNFRQEIIIRLVKEHEVHVVSPKGDYGNQLVELGCTLHNIALSRHGKNLLEEIKLFLNYLKLIRELKPTIVLTFSIKPNLYGSLVCRILKTPCAPNITGLGTALNEEGFLKTLLLKMYKICLGKCPMVFFQNSANLAYFKEKGFVKENYVLLPGSGVNLERHPYEKYPSDDGIVEFLFVGRIMRDKGVREFVSAAKEIKEKYSCARFKMVGMIEPDYAKEFETLEADKYVELFGMSDDVHSFMKEADVVVVPSYHEGMSNVSLEAAATGRPVICSDIPGCREIVDDSVTGFKFEVKNTQDLVSKMEEFIALPFEDKEKMGVNGREKIEQQFNRELVVAEYAKLAKQEWI